MDFTRSRGLRYVKFVYLYLPIVGIEYGAKAAIACAKMMLEYAVF